MKNPIVGGVAGFGAAYWATGQANTGGILQTTSNAQNYLYLAIGGYLIYRFFGVPGLVGGAAGGLLGGMRGLA